MKNDIILETERLYLRKMTYDDLDSLRAILCDPEVMYAYEHAFDDDEVNEWLEKQLKRYENDGFGLWAVILRSTGEMIGQCGLTYQDCDGERVIEIGYLFAKAFWHNGYATESAKGCRHYAFNKLGTQEVFSIIRDTNKASENVALRNGMKYRGTFVKHYYNIDMPHNIFSVKNKNCRR